MRIELSEASTIAERIVNVLAVGCERIQVAGSIRRKKSPVGDIEIICQPRFEEDRPTLFADSGDAVSVMDKLVNRICSGPGPLQFDSELKRNGPRYKRLDWDGIKVDLFIVLPDASWGSLFAIRTGPAEFGHLLVTKRAHGGAMPDELRQERGSLWGPSGKIETHEEEDFFAVLSLPTWEPKDRSEQRLRQFLRLSPEARSNEIRTNQPAYYR